MPNFNPATFTTCYIGIATYIINITGWKLLKGTKRVKAHEMDLVTGRREFEEMEERARIEESGKENVREKMAKILRLRKSSKN